MLTMDRLPLRVRLAIWYSLGFAISFWAIGLASMWLVHSAILNLENNELSQRVRSVRRFLEGRPADEDPAARSAAITAAYNVTHGSKWLQVIDEHGRWLYRSPHVAAAYPSLTLPQDLKTNSTYFNYTTGDLHVRALIAPIEINGLRYTVLTGLTLNKSLVILSNVRYQLFCLVGAGILLSSFAGYFMSRKALRPIAVLASEAQQITDQNLDARMPTLHSRDELAALSETLNQMLGRIEDGYQSVRSFTANAAHELRTPVARLHAEAEIALDLPRDPAYYRDTCEKVLQTASQMSRLIDQLLSLARADAGVEMLTMERLNLDELAQEAAGLWEEIFAKAGVMFTVSSSESWVRGDYQALKRALNIFLENAWRYVPSGASVMLQVTQYGDMAEITVADTGPGIEERDREKIFERFARGTQPVRGSFSGSGLGLAIASWIVKSHRSTITLYSEAGSGSRFSFMLPTCPAPEPMLLDHSVAHETSVFEAR